MASIEPIASLPGVWRLAGETNGYLLVRGEHSLLIDCPEEALAPLLRQAGLPAPSVILHTQVQEEHCREWAAFPAAHVFVAAESAAVARRDEQFFADCRTQWPPSREWDSRGEEPYGIAGCTTERPPRQALRVAGVLHAGATFRWEDVELDVLALPGSGKRAIGFYWRDAQSVFTGDLLFAGGYLVNFYDLERGYGILTGYAQLHDSLARVDALAPGLLLPSSGPISSEPARDIAALRARLGALLHAPALRADEPVAAINYAPRREFGRYREVLPGVFQCTNAGNMILFVDAQGRGLLVDPDPCVWLSWEDNCREMHQDLDLLESETGLQRVETALLTHYHGDHLQYCHLLRERYGTEILTTPDVATLLAHAPAYPYPCMLNWYGFPFDNLFIDRCMYYNHPSMWNNVLVTPIHLPGHCFAHTGFSLQWQGQKIVCTGDALQYGMGPIGISLPILYNDSAWPDRGTCLALQRIMAEQPDLLLCGHSQSFFDLDLTILSDLVAMAVHGERLAAALVPDGQLLRSMTPPGYDALRPSQYDCPV